MEVNPLAPVLSAGGLPLSGRSAWPAASGRLRGRGECLARGRSTFSSGTGATVGSGAAAGGAEEQLEPVAVAHGTSPHAAGSMQAGPRLRKMVVNLSPARRE